MSCSALGWLDADGEGIHDPLTKAEMITLLARLRVDAGQGYDRSGDPIPYDAVLYLLYREPARLPWCFRTMFLDTDPCGKVWRAEFAVPLSGICGGLPEINEQVSVPDLPGEWENDGDILSLHRMGILRGIDDMGTFAGREWLTRGQAAMMADRALSLFQKTAAPPAPPSAASEVTPQR